MSVQFFSTKSGVAKREGENLRLLDVPATALQEALCSNTLDTLNDAPELGLISIEAVEFMPPLDPGRIILAGANYLDHINEIGMDVPPTIKYSPAVETADTIIASGEAILAPTDYPDNVDYESEIALIVGKGGSNISREDAWDYISGVTAINDVSARDLQMILLKNSGIDPLNPDPSFQPSAGDLDCKMKPTFKPLGPGVLSAQDVRTNGVSIKCFVNGELRQSALFSDLIFGVPEIIETITADYPICPGDVILTGSPGGVGFFQGKSLVDGDLIEVQLGDMPPLANRFQGVG